MCASHVLSTVQLEIVSLLNQLHSRAHYTPEPAPGMVDILASLMKYLSATVYKRLVA